VAVFDTPRDHECTLKAWQLRPVDRKNVKRKKNPLSDLHFLAQVVTREELANESDRA
jgi:hypothetical protein